MNRKKRKVESSCIHGNVTQGSVVWAKLGSHRWWPAIVISASACGHKETKVDHLWIFWFGDHKISELPLGKIIEFSCNFLTMYAQVSGKKLQSAVNEALEIIASRCNYNYDSTENLISWAEMGFKTSAENGIFNTDIPVVILKHLEVIVKPNQGLDTSKDTTALVDITQQTFPSNDLLDKVRNGSLNIRDVCIACRDITVEIESLHPLFKGGLCLQCKERLMENIFAYGDDGKNVCCIICSKPGTLVLCDNDECPRSYCVECIALLACPADLQKIVKTVPWFCFFCPEHKMEYGLIQIRKRWKKRLFHMFQPSQKSVQEISMMDYVVKKPIKVLSLFDGISTGKLVLDSLGLEIDKYFCCEIDNDAINVSKLNHKDSIVYNGDITLLTEEKIQSMCPIDLVIGGSPCNDLSLVNHCRKGLYDPTGTGHLFFDFFHVLKTVQRLNGGKHVFFLYENVANMETKYKKVISTFLMIEPILIDARNFSPQIRTRYYWGNIPGMHSLDKYSSFYSNTCLDVDQDKVLNNFLLQHMGRQAVVEKIRTVTTQQNSLIQDSSTCLKPVKMNGEPDVLWVTELERVFGFPVHYTDTGYLNVANRRKLLGRSWSVPVIKTIFRPLLNFFKNEV